MGWLLQQCQITINISKHSQFYYSPHLNQKQAVYGLIPVLDYPLSSTDLRILINIDNFSRLLQGNGGGILEKKQKRNPNQTNKPILTPLSLPS